MKTLFLIPVLLLTNFVFLSSVKAQNNTQQIVALLDSIKNCYTGLAGYSFDYGKQEPKLISETDSVTRWSFGNRTDCDAVCLCNSNIGFTSPHKEYLRIFSVSCLKVRDFFIDADVLYLKTTEDDLNIPFTLSHPDPIKLMKIKMWVENLVLICASVSPGK